MRRAVHAEVPPRVEYALTAHGRTLHQALGPLGAWGTERIRREDAAAADVPGTSGVPGRAAVDPGHEFRVRGA